MGLVNEGLADGGHGEQGEKERRTKREKRKERRESVVRRGLGQ
jgi:hypothetical protein